MEWLYARRRPECRRPHGLLLLIAGLLVSLFAGLSLFSTTASAAPEAIWSGQSLRYEDAIYNELTDARQKTALGRTAEERVYSYSRNTNNPSGIAQEILTIHFPAGTTPSSASEATHTRYSASAGGTYSPQSSSTIAIKGTHGEGNPEASSCAVTGIGYLVCPIVSSLAKGMDNLYEWLTVLFKAPPLGSANDNSGIKLAWEIMRNLANAAFIVGFLIVIYSHLTSVGLTNYNIKKLLPRLIVAAVLVNTSFIISLFVVDLSNIAGTELHKMLIEVREQVAAGEALQQSGGITWDQVAAGILSNGAVAAGVVYGSLKLSTSLLPLFLALLAGMVLILIVVLVILAARQALIVILVIISPLAFVCYLLPGTEKWFEKWRNSLFTMLIFFPAFALVFGGASLAAAIIMQIPGNAVMAILGLGVQVAPLALTPLILKLSGGVLSRFAGLVNDKAKGPFDRAKKFSMDWHRKKENERLTKDKLSPTARALRALRRRSHSFTQSVEDYQKKADNSMEAWRLEQVARNERRASEELAMRAASDHLEASKGQVEVMHANTRAGYAPFGLDTSATRGIQASARSLAIQGLQQEGAKRISAHRLATELSENEQLRDLVGEVENLYDINHVAGSTRALAAAKSAVSAHYEESIKNATAIINSANLTNAQIVGLVNGISSKKITVTDDIRIAAARQIAGGADGGAIQNLLETAQFKDLPNDLAQELGEALNNNSAKPFWLGSAECSNIKQKTVLETGDEFIIKNIITSLQRDKLSAEKIVNTDAVQLAEFKKLLEKHASAVLPQLSAKNIAELKSSLALSKSDPLYAGRLGERADAVDGLLKLL